MIDCSQTTFQRRDGIAVVLIDCQEDFLAKLHPDDRQRLIEANTGILTLCAHQDVPVVIMKFTGNGGLVKPLRDVAAQVPRVRQLNKIDNGGFTNYQLYQGLQAWQVEDLIFGGVNASYCVWTTMNSATCHSYRVHTARDLIANAAAEREEEFERAIARISRKGRVYDSHQVLLKDLLPANI